MTQYGYNKCCLQRDGKPWFPVMGEIHYSRYPHAYWKESLYKMKAGGIDIVSAYVIWIHHEEEEGSYDFSGQRDLRTFIKTVKSCGMKMLLRIGPWVHGEVRNGGFPDWLLKKGIGLRSNDPEYLKIVEQYYKKIYEQVQGYLEKDGGPIIGIQIENEYGHVGGLQGEEGELHMHTLKEMAIQIGFDVPLYTVTGWGGAVTGGMLPVMAGYCEAPWDQRLTEIEPNDNYIFASERNDPNIANEYETHYGLTFNPADFPYLTAELGGGLQVTHHRRPVARGKDIGAMSLTKMGSGCNLLGYYMYHGGTNPEGKLSTLQESKETGYSNDVPVKSYDFNAPIKEFGQLSDTYREIKLLSTFLHDFGEELCEMDVYFPEGNPTNASNFTDLRYTVRHNGKSGYVFINNYQRRRSMKDHSGVRFQVLLSEEKIEFPAIDIKDGEYAFLPFNFQLTSDAVLKTALATPFCKLNGTTWVFYGNQDPQFHTEGNLTGIHLICITREEALMASKITLDQEYLFLSDSDVIPMEDGIHFRGRTEILQFKTHPALTCKPDGFTEETADGFGIYKKDLTALMERVTTEVIYQKADEEEKRESSTYRLSIPGAKQAKETAGIVDAFLEISYDADRYELYNGHQMITDHFYTGQIVETGLKRFAFPEELKICLYPYEKDAPVFMESYPELENGRANKLKKVRLIPEWEVVYKI